MAGLALIVVAMATGVFQQQDVLSMDYPEVNIPASEVHTVRIETAEYRMVLEKAADGWYLEHPIKAPIESPQIEGFLRRIADFDIGGVLTAESGRYAEYGVTPELGRQVEVEWDGGKVDFIVAGSSEDYQESYVRVGRDPRVFYLGRRMPVTDTPTLWRDKRIVHIDPSRVESISIEGPDRDYTIHRTGEGGLSLEPGGRVDSTAAARVVGYYSMLRTDSFGEGGADDVREAPDVTVVIRHDEGETVLRWKRVDDFYAVVRDDDDTVYRLSANRINSIAPVRSRVLAD
jgi:hypothetical protein